MTAQILYALAFLALGIGSITDLQKREVADWVNYSLIICGIAVNLIFSVHYWDYSYILNSILGLLLSLAIGLVMFYTGQWGGGDSKMLIGLGAAIGLTFSLNSFLAKFYINILFAGAFYGLFWLIILAALNFKMIFSKIKQLYLDKKFRILRISMLIFFCVFAIALFLIPESIIFHDSKLVLFFMVVFLYLMQYLWILAKAVEEVCMIKEIPVEKLTEGDWIVNDVVIGKKRICGPKDLGIESTQINALMKLKAQGKIKSVTVKNGIPFVPSFLLAFVYTYFFNNFFLIDSFLKLLIRY
ncbi:MAG: A24 family peptidase [archaeon]